MIGKVTKGNGTPKLLWYLWGPGRANEHTHPHLVAAWDGADVTDLEPAHDQGRHDIRALARLLEQPLAAQARLPTKTVWQCSLRLAPEDRLLTDAEWADAARAVLTRTGFAPGGDTDGCRWVAMRHGPDHIHLVVTLARQDGRPVDTRNDYYKLGQACRDLENQYDLRRTAPRDRNGPRRPSRAEHEKAQRAGRQFTARDELRREVRLAATATDTPSAFFDRLRERGVMVRPRHSQQQPGLVTGYAVAWPGDHNADGRPVWFGGSKLAADLSWARLQQAWQVPGVTAANWQHEPTRQTADHAAAVQRIARSLSSLRTPDDLQRLERATLTLVLAITVSGRRREPLRAAALTLDRAAPSMPASVRSPELAAITAATRWALRPHGERGDLAALLVAAGHLAQVLAGKGRVTSGVRSSGLTSLADLVPAEPIAEMRTPGLGTRRRSSSPDRGPQPRGHS